MAAPYTIRWGWGFERQSATHPTLESAVHRAGDIRAQCGIHPRSLFAPKIFGDNIDLDCADGLSREERRQLDEMGWEN